ncbi:MAG: ZIP family metal transporter [Acidobacteriota bacterium]
MGLVPILMFAALLGVALLGGALPLYARLSDERLHRFIGFGAGAILGAAFLHMLPEAAARAGRYLGVAALAGFLALFFLEKLALAHPCEETTCDYHAVGMSAFLGMSFHNLVEGCVLGSSLAQAKGLGTIVFVAIALHKLPNAMALTSLLIAARYTPARIYALLTLFALMVPLGAVGAFAVFSFWGGSSELLGVALGASAGTFLHIAASDLLPEVHKGTEGRVGNLVAFVLGLVLIGGARFLE